LAWGIGAGGKVQGGKGCGGEPDGVCAVGDAEGPEFWVLLGDRVGRGRLLEEVASEVAGERDQWDPRVRGDGRGELEESGELRPAGPWRRADEHGGASLHDEATDLEGKALGVVTGEDAGAGDLPGVEGRVLDRARGRHEREHARIAAGRLSFKRHIEKRSWSRLGAFVRELADDAREDRGTRRSNAVSWNRERATESLLEERARVRHDELADRGDVGLVGEVDGEPPSEFVVIDILARAAIPIGTFGSFPIGSLFNFLF